MVGVICYVDHCEPETLNTGGLKGAGVLFDFTDSCVCQRVSFCVLVSLDRDGFMDGTRCTFSLVRVYKPGRHPGRCDSGTANQFIVLCGITYCILFVQNPPFHLFTIVFCFVQSLFWFMF